jgi:hypothetical protein
MGKAPNLKGVNLEEIKEKLKRALGIKRDETLLYFAKELITAIAAMHNVIRAGGGEVIPT